MNYFVQIPSAPMKPTREVALRRFVRDTILMNMLNSYDDINEEAVIADLLNNNNWKPTECEILNLANKHTLCVNQIHG